MNATTANPVYNFSAGPAALPRAVMVRAQEEFLDWHGHGVSIMELSHRSKEFLAVAEQSVRDLTALLKIPDNYRILFLQGGATHLMSMTPLNLCRISDVTDYILTGRWSKRASLEAGRHARVNIVASSQENNFTTIPDPADWRFSGRSSYLYFCDNETIGGVEFQDAPEPDGGYEKTPLVSDMTSNFLSRPVPVDKYGIIFAGAQKNIGPAGLTVVIIRADLLDSARPDLPLLYDFAALAERESMVNTPPTFNWYMAGLTFAWIREQGGVEQMHRNALARSGRLYEFIDANDFYDNPVDARYRSRMNVPFTLADSGLDAAFLAEAADNGMIALRGHRSVGGMRASMYNGMPPEAVETLVEFMAEFAGRHG